MVVAFGHWVFQRSLTESLRKLPDVTWTLLEPVFHPDSYGYRPGKSAIDAVRTARERCWRYDWVLDLDVQAYFGRRQSG
jgi:retron-type reverse transcriptase